MLLFLVECNRDFRIVRITESDKIKSYLENMDFVIGETVMAVTRENDNIIVKIKDTCKIERDIVEKKC